jgi:hypothetical protein
LLDCLGEPCASVMIRVYCGRPRNNEHSDTLMAIPIRGVSSLRGLLKRFLKGNVVKNSW